LGADVVKYALDDSAIIKLKGHTFKTFMIEYDESERVLYDAITARIARSFVG
jgi:hypothetical protein